MASNPSARDAAVAAAARAQRRRRQIERFPPALRQQVIDLVASGQLLNKAADAVGMTGQTLLRFAQDDPEWGQLLDEALMTGRDPNITHGVQKSYRTHRCRCPPCREARAPEPAPVAPFAETLSPAAIAERAQSHDLVHEATGWRVDPVIGAVYGSPTGIYSGHRIGKINQWGILVCTALRNGRSRAWTLRNVVWEAVHRQAFPAGYTLTHADGDKLNLAYTNLILELLADVRRRTETVFKPGADHPDACLTAEQVEEIRHSGESGNEAGRRYGIHQSQVNRIRAGKNWKRLDPTRTEHHLLIDTEEQQ